MAEKRFDANYTFKFNSIPFQNLFSPNQLTVNNWNNIVNQLAIQSNNSSRYLKELDTWLFGSGHISYTPENFEGFLQHLVTRITNNLNKINSNISSIDGIVDTLNDTLKTIGDLDKLNTLNKETIVSALNELHSTKVEKVDGKGLSTNDYSNEEKEKVNQAYNYSTNISNLESDNETNKGRIDSLESDNTSNKQRINTLESSGFITKFVTDLINYYNKNETLSKNEIMALINAINGIEFLVVDELPTSDIKKNAIYLKKIVEDSPNQRYEEWVYVEQEFGEWERIGTTDVNLTEYLTYNPQVLTEEQKLQVFKNLGIDEILKSNAVIEISTIQDFTSDATYQSLKNLYSNVGHAAMLVLKEELEVEDSSGNRAMLWGNFHLTRISYEENIFTFSSVQISSSNIFAESIEFNVNLTEEKIGSFEVKSYTQSDSRIGDLNDLNTNNKESIVNAVNEVKNDIGALQSDLDGKIGDTTTLETEDKTNTVAAINEVNDKVNNIPTVDSKQLITEVTEIVTPDKTKPFIVIKDEVPYVRNAFLTEDNVLYPPAGYTKYLIIYDTRATQYKIIWVKDSTTVSITPYGYYYKGTDFGTGKTYYESAVGCDLKISDTYYMNSYSTLEEALIAIKSNTTTYTSYVSGSIRYYYLYQDQNYTSATPLNPIKYTNKFDSISYISSINSTSSSPYYSASYTNANTAELEGYFVADTIANSYKQIALKDDIPTVGNAILTIQKNGSSVGTFSANANTNKTINIVVPTKVSELTNDNNYVSQLYVDEKIGDITTILATLVEVD